MLTFKRCKLSSQTPEAHARRRASGGSREVNSSSLRVSLSLEGPKSGGTA